MLSSVLNYCFWMANFAARKWPEYKILNHLSQGFRGPSADPRRRAPCKRGVRRARSPPNKLCGLPKLILWGPTWPLKYFLSFKPCLHLQKVGHAPTTLPTMIHSQVFCYNIWTTPKQIEQESSYPTPEFVLFIKK